MMSSMVSLLLMYLIYVLNGINTQSNMSAMLKIICKLAWYEIDTYDDIVSILYTVVIRESSTHIYTWDIVVDHEHTLSQQSAVLLI